MSWQVKYFQRETLRLSFIVKLVKLTHAEEVLYKHMQKNKKDSKIPVKKNRSKVNQK